ncbi:uncharacterized protein LOC125591246 [Brassica napus]|uniref:uncharacterized protein LOC125591246 n=1 Tax=Brassica napus TaxID=3708 RepID=UPI0020787455|nr:uncharacterized protein LOC125591246 [Brassica napus]
MDALQSSTNHSLQAELRERTEHYNQLWLGCQRQLQHELGNVKQGGGTVPPRLSTNNQIKPRGLSPQVSQSVLLPPAKGVRLKKAVPASSEMPKQNHVHLSQGVYSLEVNGQVSPGEPNGIGSITLVSSGKTERNLESALLDERSLLACIVRTIPAGGRIRISSTLPNRLGKMLAPLHWHDYRKKYGKLEDFVASHLELFMIEDDYIQVREGAQKMVAGSASAAAGKVAVSSSPSSMYVAMTPMAQSQGLKKNVQRGRQSSDYMAPQQRKL